MAHDPPSDWNAALATGFQVLEEADSIWRRTPERRKGKESWRDHTISAADLQRKTFPPINFVVSGLIPEGLSLFCGRPKVGKSWAALDVGTAVATGACCFGGREAEQGDVLYAALEDNHRRLQRRMDKLIGINGGEWPKRLTLTTAWRRLDKGGVEDVNEWTKSVPKPRLVILDTLAGVKPIRVNNGYAEDYESLTALHRLANETGLAVLVLHHTRKMDADDPLDTISGTLGLAGCADTALVLVGSSQGMTLYVRGRDIEEAEHAVTFDKASCRWSIVGDAAEVQMSETRKAILRVLRETDAPMGPSDIAAAADLKEGVVKQRLIGLVTKGDVLKKNRGQYACA